MKNLRIIFLFFATIVTYSHAQSGVGVSPPRVELTAANLGQVTQEIVIDNPSETTTLDVTVSLQDALLNPDGSPLFLEPGSHPNSLADWISVSDLQMTLEPQASSTMTYSLQAPEGTPDGTYWGVIFFEAAPLSEGEADAGISISSRVRVGHIVYVHVGELTRGGQIEGLRYIQGGEPELRVMFRNSGNSLVRPTGRVELRSQQGDLVQTLEIPASAVFPGYASEIVGTFEEPLPSGDYIALAVLDYGSTSVTAGEGQIQIP